LQNKLSLYANDQFKDAVFMSILKQKNLKKLINTASSSIDAIKTSAAWCLTAQRPGRFSARASFVKSCHA
jgi:hypothetical protein